MKRFAGTRWIAALGALAVVLVGVPLAAALNVWVDEAFALHTTGHGLASAWSGAITFEDQPPLYFLIESAWRMSNEASVTFARLPSVFFVAGAVAIIIGVARRLAPRTPPLVVAAFTAGNPVFIWAAVEIRVYALVLFISAVLTWTFVEGFLVERPSRAARVAYAIFALAGVYTQYFVGFVLVAHGISVFVLRRRNGVVFLGLMALVALGFAPFVAVALTQAMQTGDSVARATPLDAAREIVHALFVYVSPHDVSWWKGSVKLAGVGLALVLALGFALVGRIAAPSGPARGVLFAWCVALVVFVLAFSIVGLPIDLVRHLIVLAPPTVLVVAILLSSLQRGQRLACAIVCAVFALLAGAQFAVEYHAPLAKQGDWKRVAALLAHDGRSIPIAVFPAEYALPLAVYLPVPTIAIPRAMPFTLEYVEATALTGAPDVARVLDPVQARAQRLWIVTPDECRSPDLWTADYHCTYLERYLQSHYQLEKTVELHEVIARLYVRRQPPRAQSSTPANHV